MKHIQAFMLSLIVGSSMTGCASQQSVDDLNKRVDALTALDSTAIKAGNTVQLESKAWSGTCIDDDARNAANIQGHKCNDTAFQSFIVNKR